MDDRRIRVLMQPFFFFSEEWNGMDEHLLLLAKYLDRERFELLLLVHESDGPQTPALAERSGMRALAAPYRDGAGARQRLSALRALYARERIDLLHMHSPVAGGQAAPALAARLARVRGTLITYHQVQPARLPGKTRAINTAVHSFLIDRTLAVSRGVKETVITAAGVPRGRVQVMHNGIDPLAAMIAPAGEQASLPAAFDGDPPSPPAPLPARERGEGVCGEVRIGYFGRLSPEKGVGGLLDAFARMPAGGLPVRLLIAGDGGERAALEARAAQLGIAEQVRFLGFRADARQLMERVDIVVHAPIYEGFGLVVVEAMAAGRPVVTNTAPGGIGEIVIPNETALVAPAGDADALAEALTRVARDPDTRRRLGENGRARYEQHFSARVMAQRVADRYLRLLRQRGQGQGRPRLDE